MTDDTDHSDRDEPTDWPKPWDEVRGAEQLDETTISYDHTYLAFGNDDAMRLYDGTVFVRADAGDPDRNDAEAWYPLREYVDALASRAVERALDDAFRDSGGRQP